MAENLICSKLSLLLYQTASGYISFKQRKGCLGFPGDADGKKSAYNMGDPDLIPGSEGSPGAGRSNPLQYCCLENSMDRGASQATIHWIAKSCCCFCEVASIVSDSLRLLGRQPTRLPRSLGFSRQEHWSGLPFPSPMHEREKWKWSRSVVSDPQRPHGLQQQRLTIKKSRIDTNSVFQLIKISSQHF